MGDRWTTYMIYRQITLSGHVQIRRDTTFIFGWLADTFVFPLDNRSQLCAMDPTPVAGVSPIS
jgi:hypothetical protein